MSLLIPGFSVAFGLDSGSAATVHPTFRAALVAYWKATSELVAVSPAPYADVAPLAPTTTSYCVLSEISSTASERGTRKRAFREDAFYQFAVYHPDQSEAVLRGDEMVAQLDKIQDTPLLFARGYQRGWWWQGGRLLKVPEITKSGATAARTIWQQTHTYKLTVGRRRGE